MATLEQAPEQRESGSGAARAIVAGIGRVLVAISVPIVAFVVLWRGFLFLRDSDADRFIIAGVAIVWGVGGVAMLYVIANWLISKLPSLWQRRFLPYLFVGPALAILAWYLLLPTARTFYLALFDARSVEFVGADNFIFALTDPAILTAFRNNVLWLTVGTGVSVSLGLIIAVLADRSGFERVAKTLVFVPMAISFVGASVIWRLVYDFKPATQEQIGSLNAVVTSFGLDPQAWLLLQPWNTFFLIAILVWTQTGFAMVVLSAALKGVPEELLEAARIDGASEVQIFLRIIIPVIRGSIVTVATTILILTIKVYDIVWAMTGGRFNTDVVATLQFKQMNTFLDFGRGSALAIVLLIAVIPIIYYNLRQFRRTEAF